QPRFTLFDVSKHPVTARFQPVQFKWQVLSITKFNGMLYGFGIDEDELRANKSKNASIKVARLNGNDWEEMPSSFPFPSYVKTEIPSLDAIALKDSIKVLWRFAQNEQVAGVDAPRFTTDGKLAMLSFDGEKFGAEPVVITSLPRGNTS